MPPGSGEARVWFAPEDMKGGRKLHEEIFRAIQIHDKLLLVLSKSSVKSEWVMTEILFASIEMAPDINAQVVLANRRIQ